MWLSGEKKHREAWQAVPTLVRINGKCSLITFSLQKILWICLAQVIDSKEDADDECKYELLCISSKTAKIYLPTKRTVLSFCLFNKLLEVYQSILILPFLN